MFSCGAAISKIKGSILFLELIMYKQHYDLLQIFMFRWRKIHLYTTLEIKEKREAFSFNK